MSIEASLSEASLSLEEKDTVTTRLFTILLTACSFLAVAMLEAANVTVRYKEELTHGFLMLSTPDSKPIAVGDLLQTARGSQVTAHIVYHFNDGSLQDETTVFSQRRSFSLISYHLIQKGPSFPHPTEMSLEPAKGQVTVRYTDEKGNEKTESEHMKLPSDLANGLVLTLLKNLRPDEQNLQVSMV